MRTRRSVPAGATGLGYRGMITIHLHTAMSLTERFNTAGIGSCFLKSNTTIFICVKDFHYFARRVAGGQVMQLGCL